MPRSSAALRIKLIALVGSVLLSLLAGSPALAHRPFFEEEDITAAAPWLIDDPTLSTAFYATLDSQEDVDYFRFTGAAGAVVTLGMTIPQIEGQELFAPTIVLMGPGLPAAELPDRVTRPSGSSALVLSPALGMGRPFFEPFSMTNYWNRQSERVTLPENGSYTVAVYHANGEVGRYVLVVGDKEVLGGDPAFPFKMRSYWAPVHPAAPEPSWWERFIWWR